jgi:hypothetical protein
MNYCRYQSECMKSVNIGNRRCVILLTNKLKSQGFQLSRLQAAFRKFYGRYYDLICPYNLSLDHMLSDIFHTNR